MTVACGVWAAYLPPVELPGTWKGWYTMAAAPSPAEMNRRHREFWDVESQVFKRRLADPQLVAAATEDRGSQMSSHDDTRRSGGATRGPPGDYEVGYGRPPREHQFRKGEPSRNPKR